MQRMTSKNVPCSVGKATGRGAGTGQIGDGIGWRYFVILYKVTLILMR